MNNPITIFLLCALVSVSPAADWPTFRGADRSDVSKETGLLKQWPEGGPKKIWTSDAGGLGYSGFAVVNGILYTMGSREGKEFVLALDAATGDQKWVSPVGALLTNNWGDGPRSTPTVDGDRVYALSGQGDLACLNAKGGEIVWKTKMSAFGGKVPGWGYTESVLVDGDKVVCTPGWEQGALVALNKANGEKIWQSSEWTPVDKKDTAQYSSIIAADWNGTRQYIQHTMNTFAGVNAADGKVLWRQPFLQGKTAVIPTPIFRDGKAYMAAGYVAGCVQIELGPNNEVKEVYQNTNMVNHHGGVILVGDYLYGYSDKGGWTCQDWNTGNVKWSEQDKLKKGAIHCADGMLYLLEEISGTVVLIEASPDGWKEHGRFKLEPQTTQRKPQGKVWTHPVVCNGRLYLRDQEFISCYNVKR